MVNPRWIPSTRGARLLSLWMLGLSLPGFVYPAIKIS